MRVRGANGAQEGLQRLGVQLLDPCFVAEAAIGVGDLGLVRARLQVGARGQAVDQGLHAVVGQFAQQREGAVGGAVRRDLQLVVGRAVGVAEEAVARRHRGVAACQIKTPGAVLGRIRALPAGDRRAAFGRRDAVEQLHDRAAIVHAGVVVAVLCSRHARRQQQGAHSGADQQFLHKRFPQSPVLRFGADPSPAASVAAS
ncbi:hypothetical protein D3C87_1339200 [compost metagenome]